MLRLDIAKRTDVPTVDWTRFFDHSSSYKLWYTIQIVQAVLEDGEADSARVRVLNAADFTGPRRAAGGTVSKEDKP